MQLSDRLEKIIEMTRDAGTSRCAADIGTDHGFVSIELVRRGIAKRSVASDVRKGPLERAWEHVAVAGLQEKIDLRLGDGLKTLMPGECDTVIIAGMGGMLILKIFEEGQAVLRETETLILSPHTDVPAVREVLPRYGFRIADEDMVIDKGKYYTVMRCVRIPAQGTSESPAETTIEETARVKKEDAEKRSASGLSAPELLFGPVLLRKKTPVFLDFLKMQEEKTEAILENLRKNASGKEEAIREKEQLLKMLREAGTFSA